jgi:hypothetical protein
MSAAAAVIAAFVLSRVSFWLGLALVVLVLEGMRARPAGGDRGKQRFLGLPAAGSPSQEV